MYQRSLCLSPHSIVTPRASLQDPTKKGNPFVSLSFKTEPDSVWRTRNSFSRHLSPTNLLPHMYTVLKAAQTASCILQPCAEALLGRASVSAHITATLQTAAPQDHEGKKAFKGSMDALAYFPLCAFGRVAGVTQKSRKIT